MFFNDPAYKDVVREFCKGRVELSDSRLENAARNAQKYIFDYGMSDMEAVMKAVEEVSDYRFPEYHPEDVEEYSDESILQELQNLTSQIIFILNFDETDGSLYAILANNQKVNITELLVREQEKAKEKDLGEGER